MVQGGGDLNGKLDEGSAGLMPDTTPSKVVSTELTVSPDLTFYIRKKKKKSPIPLPLWVFPRVCLVRCFYDDVLLHQFQLYCGQHLRFVCCLCLINLPSGKKTWK